MRVAIFFLLFGFLSFSAFGEKPPCECKYDCATGSCSFGPKGTPPKTWYEAHVTSCQLTCGTHKWSKWVLQKKCSGWTFETVSKESCPVVSPGDITLPPNTSTNYPSCPGGACVGIGMTQASYYRCGIDPNLPAIGLQALIQRFSRSCNLIPVESCTGLPIPFWVILTDGRWVWSGSAEVTVAIAQALQLYCNYNLYLQPQDLQAVDSWETLDAITKPLE